MIARQLLKLRQSSSSFLSTPCAHSIHRCAPPPPSSLLCHTTHTNSYHSICFSRQNSSSPTKTHPYSRLQQTHNRSQQQPTQTQQKKLQPIPEHPLDVFTGDYQKELYLTAEQIQAQLYRMFKKLQFAKQHGRNSRVILSRFHLTRILAIPESHRSHDMNKVLVERDHMVSELIDMFLYASSTMTSSPSQSSSSSISTSTSSLSPLPSSEPLLNVENISLFLQIFSHLLRFDLVWWVYDRLDSLNIVPTIRIYTLVANTCADSLDADRTTQVYQRVIYHYRQQQQKLVQNNYSKGGDEQQQQLFTPSQTFWNAIIQAMCLNVDPTAIEALEMMEQTRTGVITFQIGLALLSVCDTWSSKLAMFRSMVRKMEIYHSYQLYIDMLTTAVEKDATLDDMVELLELGLGDWRLEQKLRHNKTFHEFMVPVLRELVKAEDMDKKRFYAAKLFTLFEEMRSQDLTPSYEILVTILSAVAQVGRLNHMWIVYRKLSAAKFYKQPYVYEIMMNASVRHRDITSGIRVIRQVMESKSNHRMSPSFYTPLIRLMVESSDRRVFALYVALVQQHFIVKEVWEHGILLQQLFNQVAREEDRQKLAPLIETIKSITGIELHFPLE